MKKVLTLCVVALAGLSATAQQQVVKDAERAMKDGKTYKEVVSIITPAFTNPETANQAITWFIPGKAGFKLYDDYTGLKAFNKLPENGDKDMVEALIGGYDNFIKALPLDSVPDAKGKVKPKYSKEIVNTIAGHYNDFNVSAVEFWNLKDYANAYKSWGIYTSLPENPVFAKALQNVPADTIMAEIMYNQALAAWQMDDLDKSLDAFMRAKAKGYNKKQLYDYAIAVASMAKKNDIVTSLAEEALPLYGSEDSNYIGFIIQSYVNDKRYPEAMAMIDKAIQADPFNAQYYVIKGILCEDDTTQGSPKQMFEMALAVDPYNANALFNLGRVQYIEACAINDAAPTDEQAYGKIFYEQIKPLLKKATDNLEQSYNINNENTDALKILESAYYLMQDEANLKATQDRLNQ